MFKSGSDSQTAPCGIVAIGTFASGVADALARHAPVGEVRVLAQDRASTKGVDANITFVLWNGDDETAERVAADVEQRVRSRGALAAGVRVFSSGCGKRTFVSPIQTRSHIRIDLGRDGIEHTIACLVGAFAGAMGGRGVIGVDLEDIRAALEHPASDDYFG